MYIEKLIIHNFGIIDKFELTKDDLLKSDGNLKPIILLGKNGSGKTILLSSIADSFFESAKTAGFNDVLPKDGAGDEPTIIQKYPDITSIGNKVFAFCIPEPQHRSQYKNISIEFYYTDDEIKKQLSTGTRLYFDNEFYEMNKKNPTTKKSEQYYQIETEPRQGDEYDKKLFDDNLHRTLNKDKNPILAHSKEVFANNILDGEFVDKFNIEQFALIFTKIEEIIQRDHE